MEFLDSTGLQHFIGKLKDGTIIVGKAETALNGGTSEIATQSQNGLMSKDDKKILDDLSSDAPSMKRIEQTIQDFKDSADINSEIIAKIAVLWEIRDIPVEEDGYFYVDANMNVGAKFDSNGFHAINLIEYEETN